MGGTKAALVLGRERNLLALFGMRNNGFYDWLEKARRCVTVNATYHRAVS